jgi:hypothetical protein
MDWKNSQGIKRDSNGSAYDTPSWSDENDDGDADDVGDRRFPAAYIRTEHVEIGRLFVECGTTSPQSAVIKGLGPDQHEFKAANCIDPTATDTELVACDLRSDTPLPHFVKFYDSYTIDWEVSFADDYFVSAKSTDGMLYVTLNEPIALSYFESVYFISCSAAFAEFSEQVVVADVWAEFTDQLIERKPRDGDNVVDGKTLKYWPTSTPPPLFLDGLMAHADGWGQSPAFSQLLSHCWSVQGVSSGRTYLVERDPSDPTSGFLVKNWSATVPWTTGLTIGVDIVDDPGMGGQGPVANPVSLFEDHTIVVRFSTIFDPSYGSPLTVGFVGYENGAIDAVTDDLFTADMQSLTAVDLVYTLAGF